MKRAQRVLVLGLFAGCAATASVSAPTENELLYARKTWPSMTLADLERGRTAYLDHCATCHTPHGPREFEAKRWPGLVAEMRAQAHLSPSEETDIVRYLVAGSGSGNLVEAKRTQGGTP